MGIVGDQKDLSPLYLDQVTVAILLESFVTVSGQMERQEERAAIEARKHSPLLIHCLFLNVSFSLPSFLPPSLPPSPLPPSLPPHSPSSFSINPSRNHPLSSISLYININLSFASLFSISYIDQSVPPSLYPPIS